MLDYSFFYFRRNELWFLSVHWDAPFPPVFKSGNLWITHFDTLLCYVQDLPASCIPAPVREGKQGCFTKFNIRKFILFYKSKEYESIVSGNQIGIRFFQEQGLPPLRPRLTFCLKTKSKQKIQDCARFTRKINFIDFACVRQSSSKLDSALTYRKIGVRSAIPKAFGTKLASVVSKIRNICTGSNKDDF